MARYVVHVRTPMPQDEAFAYMADLNNFARWDPGVADVDQVKGSGAGPNAAFDVSVKAVRGTRSIYHNNGIQTWLINSDGKAENVEVS